MFFQGHLYSINFVISLEILYIKCFCFLCYAIHTVCIAAKMLLALKFSTYSDEKHTQLKHILFILYNYFRLLALKKQ